ncbi:MAG: hypothetical protein LBF22_10445 [Deltaproteobacteria bacterium]|nr:hypothetical protein [Deltaproteobacteria bacterium]
MEKKGLGVSSGGYDGALCGAMEDLRGINGRVMGDLWDTHDGGAYDFWRAYGELEGKTQEVLLSGSIDRNRFQLWSTNYDKIF